MTTHGLRRRPGNENRNKPPIYQCWSDMKGRCLNPRNKRYARYGGRGIKVHPKWIESFEAFYSHMGDMPAGMTLDRIDNDGDYTPGNVRWATYATQKQNDSRTKLTLHDVRLIRHWLVRGYKQVDIATAFNVSEGQVSSIKSGHKWKSIEA